jgi:uroporphyrinogen decarboxylase
MNKSERLTALLIGNTVDRVVHFPFLLGFCGINLGYPISSIYDNPEKSFFAQLWTHEQYGYDWGPIYGYASYGTWEFGGKIKMPDSIYEQAPHQAELPVKSEDDVFELKLPDVTKAGSLPIAMKFAKYQDKYDTQITPVIAGVFTLAGNICSADRLCRWILKKPEIARKLLNISKDHIIDVVNYWADTFGAGRVIPQIWEPLASNELISPKVFKDFVLEYMFDLCDAIIRKGIKHIFFHICGKQANNLEFWKELPSGNPGIYSVGSEMDISMAIEMLGEEGIIAGNIDPSKIQHETPDKLYELCSEIIMKGKKAPRGFMLMAGCEVPPGAPPYNVFTISKALNDFGKY